MPQPAERILAGVPPKSPLVASTLQAGACRAPFQPELTFLFLGREHPLQTWSRLGLTATR